MTFMTKTQLRGRGEGGRGFIKPHKNVNCKLIAFCKFNFSLGIGERVLFCK